MDPELARAVQAALNNPHSRASAALDKLRDTALERKKDAAAAMENAATPWREKATRLQAELDEEREKRLQLEKRQDRARQDQRQSIEELEQEHELATDRQGHGKTVTQYDGPQSPTSTTSAELQNRILALQAENDQLQQILMHERNRRFAALRQYVVLRGGVHIILRPKKGTTSDSINFDTNAGKVNIGDRSFTFDRVFAPDDGNDKLWVEEIEPVVMAALGGANVSLFAFGQTGSGKTYTMSQEPDSMIPQTVKRLFEEKTLLGQGHRSNTMLTISMTCVEIYRDKVRDLLGEDPVTYKIRPATGCFGPVYKENGFPSQDTRDLERLPVTDPDDFHAKFKLARHRRRTRDMTKFGGPNKTSSRSHVVCTLYLNKGCVESEQSVTTCIQLVDLAGSETITSDNDEAMKEGLAINKSLSHLVSVLQTVRKRSAEIEKGRFPGDIRDADFKQEILTQALHLGLTPPAPVAQQSSHQPLLTFVATMTPDGHEKQSRATCEMANIILGGKAQAVQNEGKDSRGSGTDRSSTSRQIPGYAKETSSTKSKARNA